MIRMMMLLLRVLLFGVLLLVVLGVLLIRQLMLIFRRGVAHSVEVSAPAVGSTVPEPIWAPPFSAATR